VFWTGYSSYGEPLFERLRAADLLVLPSLSEGTPHVLVEARANGLPCISTTVGGVPSSVTDGYDALLVPPENSRALAKAIERVIHDGDLRRTLIRNGLDSSRAHTLERFVGVVRGQLDRNPEGAATKLHANP
jgi:glycosyltransferase involved in cell wall biosynthesis